MKEVEIIGGTWTIGEWHWGKVEEKDAIETVEVFLDRYKFVDTAPIYGFGRSEKIIGKVLPNFKREDIKIMTKFGLTTDEKGEFFFKSEYKGEEVSVYKNADRQSIKEECKKSLERLKTDYIDIYLLHFKPSSPSLTEIAETLEELKQEGLIKKWGVCNVNTGDLNLLVKNNFKPYCLQFKYNPLFTKPEKSVIPYCRKYKIKFYAFSLFERGFLTGKYMKNNFEKEDNRRFIKNEQLEKIKLLTEKIKLTASKYNLTVPQLILTYMKTKDIDGIITGARTKKQAKENIDKIDLDLKENDLKILEKTFREFKI